MVIKLIIFDQLLKERHTSSGGYNGSYLNNILEFNPDTESWTKIGAMLQEKKFFAVSVVLYDDFAKWCS